MELESFVSRYFLIVFAAFWCMISLLISLVGGWWFLARAYRAESDFMGQRWWFRSAGFGLASYGNVLIVGANETGLHLACILPFRFGHAPILIPWSELHAKRERYFLSRVVTIRTAACPRIAIRFREKFFRKIEEAAQAWRTEPLAV